MTIDALRTPDERFANLPHWGYKPSYMADLPGYDGLRLHYVDAGPKDAHTTFLCLHGEPSWAYLYRKMMVPFLATGARVVAPDFFGFGRSDKPVDDAIYTFDFHRNALMRFIERLDLKHVCLVCQDWGGLIGLTLPMAYPDRFTRMIVMNTTLATGQSPGEGFNAWKAFVRENPDLNVGELMARAIDGLDAREAEAYDAPFPDQRYKGGVRRFPELVMVAPDMDGVETSKKAMAFLQEQWSGQSFIAVGLQDPVLGKDVMEYTRSFIRNAPPMMEVPEGGHFVQEHGEGIAHAAIKAFGL